MQMSPRKYIVILKHISHLKYEQTTEEIFLISKELLHFTVTLIDRMGKDINTLGH